MARLRIRFRLNPGRYGAPMDKLGKFSTHIDRFLRNLAHDAGLEPSSGSWLASEFKNGSVEFDAVYSEGVDSKAVQKAHRLAADVTGRDPIGAVERGDVSPQTITAFSRAGEVLDADEKFEVGFYDSEESIDPEWRPVTHRAVSEIRRFLEAPYVTLGSVQGIVHSWHKEAEPRFFNLRECVSGNLVHCEYTEDQHKLVHAATRFESMMIIVYGEIRWNQADAKIEKIFVSDIETVEALSKKEFDRLFGMFPGIDEYWDRIEDHREDA